MAANLSQSTQQRSHHGVSDQHKHLVFVLAGKRFAVPIASVRRILEYQEPQFVPMLPQDCPGIIQVSDTSVALMDLQYRFGLGKSEKHARSGVVIVDLDIEGDSVQLGIMVDSVLHVVAIHDDDVQPVPDFGANLDKRVSRGVCRSEQAVVLDLGQLLDASEAGKFRNVS
ncbi:MAG: chemotaxis protein CheW [Ketobacteraceae bacterium]|nr:chemotaxis protein CheW [Ketobacteraceae bacterium]